MEVYRSTFQMMLYEAIQTRQKFEREELKYTRDSGHLAVLRELLVKTARDESTIYLKD
jgi:hypothetical protein